MYVSGKQTMATPRAAASSRNRSAMRSRSSTEGALRAAARPMRRVDLAVGRRIPQRAFAGMRGATRSSTSSNAVRRWA